MMIRSTYITLVLLLFAAPSFAQDEGGESGDPQDHAFIIPFKGKLDIDRDKLLPAKGDWNISFSLPIFGNKFFAGSRPSSDTGLFSGFQTYVPVVMVRKFIEDDMAYRGGLQVNLHQKTNTQPVAEDTLTFDPDSPSFVEDKMHTINRSITLRLGIEKRRGNSNVQGVYGAEAIIGYFNTVQSYDYGNEMNSDFDEPNIHDFGDNDYDSEGRRVTEYKEGNRFLLGVRGFGGAEVFMRPKMSLGINVGYMLGLSLIGDSEETREYYNAGSGSIETVTTQQTPQDPLSQFGLSSYDIQLNLNYYF